MTFLCKEIKESDNLVDSDTIVTLLEYFSEISSNDGLLAKNDENKYGALTPSEIRYFTQTHNQPVQIKIDLKQRWIWNLQNEDSKTSQWKQ